MSQIREAIDRAELKEKLARAVCLFLAEMLRTRKLNLDRSAEIAARVVERLDKIETELNFLEAVRQLEFEFQELNILEQDLINLYGMSERKKMENYVRQYAIHRLPNNPEAAVEIMEEALKPDTTLDDLAAKFSEFAKFLEKF